MAMELALGLAAGTLGRSWESTASAGGVPGATSECRGTSDGALLGVSDAPLAGAQDWKGSASGGTLLLGSSDGPSSGAHEWRWSTSGGALQEWTGSASDGTPMGTSDGVPRATRMVGLVSGMIIWGAPPVVRSCTTVRGRRTGYGAPRMAQHGGLQKTGNGAPRMAPLGASTDCGLSSQGLRQSVIKHSPKYFL
jgi:hypothetical protein